MLSQFRHRLLLFVLTCLLLPGCGGGDAKNMPKLGKVKGTVTLDTKPLEKARVEFAPDSSRPSFGVTDAAGNYELTYDDRNQGAAIGNHKVRISTKLSPANDKDDKIPKKFNEQSTLTFDVKEGDNKANFDLTSK